MPMLGAANRQDDRYPNPDTFDIFRKQKANVGWGYGVNFRAAWKRLTGR